MKHVLAGTLLLSPLTAAAANLTRVHSLQAGAVIVIYLLFCSWCFWRYQKKASLAQAQMASAAAQRDDSSLLIAYASQSGQAEHLARKTATSLTGAGLSVEVRPLGMIDLPLLQHMRRVLFVVSTTGEGDAPDNAADFQQQTMSQPADLSALQYGVLALGDASYTFFCGFGYTLDAWLQHAQATPLFDMVTVDQLDDGALRHWQYQLGLLAQDSEMIDWETPSYQPWQLIARTELNPGSAGAPVYHVQLSAADKHMQWQAGDIAEIGPRNAAAAITQCLQRLQLDGSVQVTEQHTLYQALQDKLLPHDEAGYQSVAGLDAEALIATLKTLPHREYSIASIPQDGQLELLIRQTRYTDGRLGIGSGWLTAHAAVGSEIALRIRENSAFHPPAPDVPLILIGNGTGIAGLRAHLRQRLAVTRSDTAPSSPGKHWLIFGERNAQHDFHFRQELEHWHTQGLLNRLDTAFSRDQADRTYVQDVVRSVMPEMRQWVADGAAIYVCGSATGMAPAVHHVLLEALGETTLSVLTTSGRYRRDVY